MWRDKLRPASFRGVPFEVEQHSSEVAGRRVVVHQYPGRDLPTAEDLGRKASEFAVDAFVIGADYMGARDALIAACSAAGAGELVHPYLGTLTVMCTGCRLTESTGEGRMARLQLSFVEAGLQQQPAVAPNTAAAVESSAVAARDVAIAGFETGYQVRGFPQFVADAAAGIAGDLARVLMPAIGADTLPATVRAVSALAAGAVELVYSPARLGAEISAAVSGVVGGIADTARGIDTALALTGFGTGLPAVAGTTPSRLRQAANQASTVNLVRRLSTVEAVRLVPRAELVGRQDAIALRDRLADAADLVADAASAAGDDEAFAAFGGVRTSLVRHLNARAPALAQVAGVQLPATEPALVTAYRLYGDAGRAEELVARNRLRHPGFVPGGQEVEVLADA